VVQMRSLHVMIVDVVIDS